MAGQQLMSRAWKLSEGKRGCATHSLSVCSLLAPVWLAPQDLDVACKERLDFLLHYDFVTPKTTPVGVSNDIMVAKQHDPFALRLIHHLARWKTWLFVR